MMTSPAFVEFIYIEDDPKWKKIMSELISGNFQPFIKSYTDTYSEEILQLVTNFRKPCVIVIDLHLGNTSRDFHGLFWLVENLNRLVTLNHMVEVIVVSGYTPPGTIALLVRAGVSEQNIFSKAPFDDDRFLKAMEIAIGNLKEKKINIQAELTYQKPEKFSQKRIKLLYNLVKVFNLAELQMIAFEMLIPHENFSNAHQTFARELFEYCERHQMIEGLLTICQRNRPTLTWQ